MNLLEYQKKLSAHETKLGGNPNLKGHESYFFIGTKNGASKMFCRAGLYGMSLFDRDPVKELGEFADWEVEIEYPTKDELAPFLADGVAPKH